VTVVRDEPDLVALYWPAGTPDIVPRERVTPQQLVSADQLDLVERLWVDTDVLMLATPGAAHAVYAMWEHGHTSFRCWYVDLQEPLRRTPIGFDTMDHLLDIVVSPDRSEWRWKDENEFAEAVAIGVFALEEARAIRAEGERVIGLLETNESPFCDGWESWSPPPQWGIPGLPEDWETVAIQDSSL
jgi:hypothetical protein